MSEYQVRHIDPIEFTKAKTNARKWELLRQLATNMALTMRIARDFYNSDEDDFISEATIHAFQNWDKWNPARGDGFKFFSYIMANRMKRIARNDNRDRKRYANNHIEPGAEKPEESGE